MYYIFVSKPSNKAGCVPRYTQKGNAREGFEFIQQNHDDGISFQKLNCEVKCFYSLMESSLAHFLNFFTRMNPMSNATRLYNTSRLSTTTTLLQSFVKLGHYKPVYRSRKSASFFLLTYAEIKTFNWLKAFFFLLESAKKTPEKNC